MAIYKSLRFSRQYCHVNHPSAANAETFTMVLLEDCGCISWFGPKDDGSGMMEYTSTFARTDVNWNPPLVPSVDSNRIFITGSDDIHIELRTRDLSNWRELFDEETRLEAIHQRQISVRARQFIRKIRSVQIPHLTLPTRDNLPSLHSMGQVASLVVEGGGYIMQICAAINR